MRKKIKKIVKPPPPPRANPMNDALVEVLDMFMKRQDLARGVAEIHGSDGKLKKVPLTHTDGMTVWCFGNYEICRRVQMADCGFIFYLLRGNAGDVEGAIPKMLDNLSEYFLNNPKAFRLSFPYKKESLPELSHEACLRFREHAKRNTESGGSISTQVKMRYPEHYLEQKFVEQQVRNKKDEQFEQAPPKPPAKKRLIR